MRIVLPLLVLVACGLPSDEAPVDDSEVVADTDVAADTDEVVDTDVVGDTDVVVDTDTDPVDTDTDPVDTDTDVIVDTDTDTDAALDTDAPLDTDTDAPLDTEPPEVVTNCPALGTPTGVALHLGTTQPGHWTDYDTGDTDDTAGPEVFFGERLVVDDAGYAALELELDTTLPTADFAQGPVYVRWEVQHGCSLGGWPEGTWYADEGALVMAWEDASWQCGFACDAFGPFIGAWQLPGAVDPVIFCTHVTITGRCEDSGL